MRRLLLLRHAKSERAVPGAPDRERALNARGRTDAPRMGAYLARHDLVPDLAIVSAARRTRQTWDLLAAEFGETPPVVFEERIYEAGPQALFEVIAETRPETKCLLLVGHNPGLHEFTATLIASGDLDARQRLGEELPTSGLVVIDLPLDDWTRLHPHAGRLERFVTPRSLATATD
jgi:phosphohistidine phosphatase